MITNLDFLNVGKEWVPASESERLEMYKYNHALFESKHADVYAENLRRIERVIGNFDKVISYPVVVNFQKLMTLKIADLLVGEPPQIKNENDKKQETIKNIIDKSGLQNTLYQLIIDVSRYGDGLFYVRQENGTGIIDITQPSFWFPVVNPDNVRDIKNHILAWTYDEDCDKQTKKLKVQIHNKGNYEERIYLIANNIINKLIQEPIIYQTGLSDYAVIPIHNIITSDRVTGIDDYTDIDSIIADIMVRIGQIDRILDKHAAPSMSGPTSALERDPVSGELRLKAGNFYPRDNSDDPTVEYITWEGQLAANFTQLEKLMNLLYTISEMGSALFGDLTTSTGQVPSGTALKRLMISPLAKVNRIRMRLDEGVKKAIILCSEIGSNKLQAGDVTINWQDGLPGDDVSDAEIMAKRTGKPTMSQKRALMQYDGMTEEDADEELAQIQDEEASLDMVNIPPINENVSDGEAMLTEGEIEAPQGVKQSLNGAQMQSLLAVLSSYQTGMLSRQAAINLIVSSLPLSQTEAESIVEENKK